MKSVKVKGDFSCISPSMKSKVYPWSAATIPKKQSSALEPASPQSNVTFLSAPACKINLIGCEKYLNGRANKLDQSSQNKLTLQYGKCATSWVSIQLSSTHIAHHVGALPAEYRLVEIGQLAPDLAEVLADPDAVRHGAHTVLQVLEVAPELGRVVGVRYHSCTVNILWDEQMNIHKCVLESLSWGCLLLRFIFHFTCPWSWLLVCRAVKEVSR